MRPLLRLLPYLLPSASRLCIVHQFQANARVLAQCRCLNVSAAVSMPSSDINLLHDWKSSVRFRHMFRVEQLPSAATVGTQDVFSEFGTVVEATIKRDKENNRSRGFGFVTFSTVKAAQSALAGEPYQLDGRRIGVKVHADVSSKISSSDRVPLPGDNETDSQNLVKSSV